MAQDVRIVVDLLDRHARVPSREEILERYSRTYRGRKLGIAAGGEALAPEPAVKEPEPEVQVPAKSPEEEMASDTPTREMEAVTGALESPPEEGAREALTEPASREPQGYEDLQPMHGIPAVVVGPPDDGAPVDEANGDYGENEVDVPEEEASDDRSSGRPHKKKKRKKRRGLGA